MTRDLYADALWVAEQLRSAGEHTCSDRIIEAVEGGSTETEILMALRHQLTSLQAARLDLPSATEEFVALLRDEIAAALDDLG